MSNVVYISDYRLRLQAKGVQKVSRLIAAQLERKEQIKAGMKHLKRLPRMNHPDHEPPGAA